jgi:predicted secreted protein
MIRLYRLTALGLAAAALALAPLTASAEWQLDAERSQLAFISVKNASVGEIHHFRDLRGGVDDDGSASVTVELASVDTAIPIRDERMRKMLFETASFPQATLSASVDAALLDEAGTAPLVATVPVTVALHGSEVDYEAELLLSLSADGALHVLTRRPILVDVADFDLGSGVDALRRVAGLDSISSAVPVTAHLVFASE